MHQIIRNSYNNFIANKVLANSGWLITEKILYLLINSLVGIFIARYLQPVNFGLLSYATTFVGLFYAVSNLGLEHIFVREILATPKSNKLLRASLYLRILSSVMAIILMFIVILLTEKDSFTSILLIVVSISLLFRSFEVIRYYFESKLKAKYPSMVTTSVIFITSIIKIYLIFLKVNVLAFATLIVFEAFVISIGYIVIYKIYSKNKEIFPQYSWQISKRLLTQSWPLLISAIMATLYMRLDQLMIKHILGNYEVGIYASAVKLSEMWYFIPIAISKSVFPEMIKSYKTNRNKFNIQTRKLLIVFLTIPLLVAIFVSVFSHYIIEILYGTNYAEASQVLSISIWASVFIFVGVILSNQLIILKKQKYFSLFTTQGAILNFLLNLVLIPFFGINGAAWATLISYGWTSIFAYLQFSDTRNILKSIMRTVSLKRIN